MIVFKSSNEPTYLPPLVHGVIERPLAQFLTLIKCDCDELALALLRIKILPPYFLNSNPEAMPIPQGHKH